MTRTRAAEDSGERSHLREPSNAYRYSQVDERSCSPARPVSEMRFGRDAGSVFERVGVHPSIDARDAQARIATTEGIAMPQLLIGVRAESGVWS